MSQNRKPKGSRDGGQYNFGRFARADGNLSDSLDSFTTLSADPDELDEPDSLDGLLASPSSRMRARAACRPDLTEDQAVELAQDPNAYVRWTVMCARPAPRVLAVIRQDRDPLLRATAACEGLLDWDE